MRILTALLALMMRTAITDIKSKEGVEKFVLVEPSSRAICRKSFLEKASKSPSFGRRWRTCTFWEMRVR